MWFSKLFFQSYIVLLFFLQLCTSVVEKVGGLCPMRGSASLLTTTTSSQSNPWFGLVVAELVPRPCKTTPLPHTHKRRPSDRGSSISSYISSLEGYQDWTKSSFILRSWKIGHMLTGMRLSQIGSICLLPLQSCGVPKSVKFLKLERSALEGWLCLGGHVGEYRGESICQAY